MTDEQKTIHKQFAVNCFNAVWDLLDKKDRTPEDDINMIHTAHASRYHWGLIGTPLEFQRGEWQISRVYATLKQGNSALKHAEVCFNTCKENKIADFDMAFACEAMARANAVIGNIGKRDVFIEMAKKAAKEIEEEENKEYFLSELESVKQPVKLEIGKK